MPYFEVSGGISLNDTLVHLSSMHIDPSNDHKWLTIVYQSFIRAQINENIKAQFTGHRWVPLTKASDVENVSIWWRHHVYL